MSDGETTKQGSIIVALPPMPLCFASLDDIEYLQETAKNDAWPPLAERIFAVNADAVSAVAQHGHVSLVKDLNCGTLVKDPMQAVTLMGYFQRITSLNDTEEYKRIANQQGNDSSRAIILTTDRDILYATHEAGFHSIWMRGPWEDPMKVSFLYRGNNALGSAKPALAFVEQIATRWNPEPHDPNRKLLLSAPAPKEPVN